MNDDQDELRTASQNDKFWPGLRDISRQVMWPQFEGDGQIKIARMDETSWKCVITAGLKQQQRMAQGIEGGWVMLGESTSKMKKRRFCELLTLMKHFGDSKQVMWSDPKWLAEVAAAEAWLREQDERQTRKAA